MNAWLPPHFEPWMIFSLAGASFFAGFVDAVVGGGGLIQLPAMFATFPSAVPALLIGTNKFAAVFGTSAAAIQYGRRTTIDWHSAAPAAIAALVWAFLGAMVATRVPASVFRAMLPVILIGVAWYVFRRKDLGQVHAPRHTGEAAQTRGALVGSAIGFYDGLFGPGTGSFLAFLFVRVFGFDFLRASAAAKVINVACNIAGIVAFILFGGIWFGLGLLMALFNVLGSLAGSTIALRLGSGFIRKVFLVVVVALILKTTYDGVAPYWRAAHGS